MTVPKLKFTKSDGNTGAIPPSNLGVAAIIAIASAGPVNVPATFARQDLAYNTFSDGYLAEDAAMVMDVSGNQAVCIRPTTSNAAAYGAVTYTGTGGLSGSVTAHIAQLPVDDFDIVVKFVTGGTTGTAGITYQVSLDGGQSFGPTLALGTGLSISATGKNGNVLAEWDLVTAKTVVAG